MNAGTLSPAGTLRAAWRVLTQPIGGPTLVIGRRWRPAPSSAGEVGADLPPGLRAAAAATVRNTRLWPRERSEVMRELCAHFEAGLDAGDSEEELMRRFGDPRTTGKMIGVAKRRSRALVYRGAARAAQVAAGATVLLGASYGGLAAWYYSAPPGIAADLRRQLRPPVADDQSAAPLYRQALLGLPKSPAVHFDSLFWADLWPGDPGFEEVRGYLEGVAPALDLIRQGAARPSVGRAAWDAELAQHLLWMCGADELAAPPPDLGENPPLILESASPAARLRFLSWHVLADARLAITAADADRFLADVVALVGLAGQARAEPRIASDMLAFLIYGDALYVGADAVLDSGFLSEAQLLKLAELVSAFGGGDDLTPDLAGERIVVEDFLRRICAGDDADGRISAAGIAAVSADMAVLAEHERVVRFPQMQAWMASLGPAGAAMAASRGEMLAEYDRLVAVALAEATAPMSTWTHPPGDAEHRRVQADRAWQARYGPVSSLYQNIGHILDRAADAAHRRDALLTAIALELHRRRHGEYPRTLGELVPGLLAAVPLDRYTGRPLTYGILGGRPLLYSFGADRNDDGGEPPDGPFGNTRANTLPDDRFQGATPDGDWVLWPRTRFDANGRPLPIPEPR